MFGRRIRSALFIDYENISHSSLPDRVSNWLAWLEDGEFDEEKRPRQFVEKRIYWNTTAEKYREQFKAAGFEPILCEKFFGLKNGADIRIVLDAYDLLRSRARISEYIFISLDTDYVPLLQRLAQHSKQTAILVSEQSPHAHTTFSSYADLIIPLRRFREATEYVRPKQTFAERVRSILASSVQAKKDPLELATDHVVRVTSLRSNQYTARAAIESELRKIKGFSTTGKARYLGKETYGKLMLELAKRSDRLVVDLVASGVVHVKYVPKDESD